MPEPTGDAAPTEDGRQTDPMTAAGSPAHEGRGAGSDGIELPIEIFDLMAAHCLDALPEEGCGLLAGHPATGSIVRCYPTRNAAASAKLYEVDPLDYLRADRDAEAEGLEILGVFHSHTHTDAYPSPTDVAQAPDPSWHYVLVSLRHEIPTIRSYRIRGEVIEEEPIALIGPPDRDR